MKQRHDSKNQRQSTQRLRSHSLVWHRPLQGDRGNPALSWLGPETDSRCPLFLPAQEPLAMRRAIDALRPGSHRTCPLLPTTLEPGNARLFASLSRRRAFRRPDGEPAGTPAQSHSSCDRQMTRLGHEVLRLATPDAPAVLTNGLRFACFCGPILDLRRMRIVNAAALSMPQMPRKRASATFAYSLIDWTLK